MSETMSSRTWMSDLEMALADDADGKVLRERKDEFLEYAHKLKMEMQAGMGMKELQATMDMKKAAEAAVHVLEHLWRKTRNELS